MKKQLAIAIVLVTAGVLHADWFNVPGVKSPTTAPTGSAEPASDASAQPTKLPERNRTVSASLADHAVFFALDDLGISQAKLAPTIARLAQTPALAKLPGDRAFLVGIRLDARIHSELQRLGTPARAAAAKALGDASEYCCTLPMKEAAPRDAAARLEQAVFAAQRAVRAQGVRLQFSQWLDEAMRD